MPPFNEGNVKVGYVGDGDGEGTVREKREEGKWTLETLTGVVDVGMNEEAEALRDLEGE
jgi:hypothetical protein